MKKYLLPLLIITILFGCKKEDPNNNTSAALHFSTDTITFDTIFASIGSITKTLTVYNHNNYDVKSNISIKGNSSANFRMNIDGISGNNQKNINIPSQDSIFIFLEVTIDSSNNNTPYVLTDSLVFTNGTKKQDVDLVAWGQDAYYHTPNLKMYIDIDNNGDSLFSYPHYINEDQNWNNTKPHIITGDVIIAENTVLTIEAGSRIYFHKTHSMKEFYNYYLGTTNRKSAGIIVLGTIKINGTASSKVTFQGDRLDPWYKDIPGQWDKIWLFRGSVDNEINHAIIKNGSIGIHADTVTNNNPTVVINNTIIKNMSGIGILGQGAHITATNTEISKCGQHAVACNIGGTYSFTHCTFANYWDYTSRNTPSILLNNYYQGADGNIYIRDLNSAIFTNCIIDGNLSTEVSFQAQELGSFNYNFDHCLIKLDPTINTENTHYENVIINQSPRFVDNTKSDFHLSTESPVIDAGNNSTEGTSDIEGNLRSNPDIGAYEFID